MNCAPQRALQGEPKGAWHRTNRRVVSCRLRPDRAPPSPERQQEPQVRERLGFFFVAEAFNYCCGLEAREGLLVNIAKLPELLGKVRDQ